jgi:arylsulfatase A-like enzyme
MFRRAALLVSLAGIVAAVMLPAAASAKNPNPNVLVVMTDDMSYDNLQFMPKTSSFFKKNGTSFTKNYVTYPLCCPARTTFLTGQLTHNHGVDSVFSPDNFIGWKTKDNQMASWLQSGGYRTGVSGKYLNGYGELDQLEVPKGWDDWQVSIDETTIDAFNVRYNRNGKLVEYGDPDWIARTHAFSEVVGQQLILDYPGLVSNLFGFFMSRPKPWTFGTTVDENYTTSVEAETARQFMAAGAKSKKPWFQYYTPPSQHREDIAEQANAGQDIGINPRVPSKYIPRVENLKLPRTKAFAEKDMSDKRKVLQEPTTPNTNGAACVVKQCISKLTHYYQGRAGASMALDDEIGKMIDELKASGQLSKTLIIFTSDNGWLMGQHNINGNKYLPYEESIHVPLMMAGPGVPKGKTNNALVANVDLSPTIVAATGAKARRTTDGMSLFKVMKDPSKGRTAVPLEATRKLFVKPGAFPNPEDTPYYGVRTKDWMYAKYLETGDQELYDMVRDPAQMNNLAKKPGYAKQLAAMAKLALQLKTCKGKACVR